MDRKWRKSLRFLELYGTKFPLRPTANNSVVQAQQADDLILRGREAMDKAVDEAIAASTLVCARNGVGNDTTVTIMTGPRSNEEMTKTLRSLLAAISFAEVEVIAFGTSVEEATESFKKFGVSLNQEYIEPTNFKAQYESPGFYEPALTPKKQQPYFRQFEKKRRNK